jgi:hypothetical protein
MKLRSIGVATAVVSILGVGGAREARGQDLPCVQAEDSPPPYNPPLHRRSYAYDAAYRGYASEMPSREMPPRERRIPIEITASAGYAFTTGVGVQTGTLALAPSPVFGATVDVANLYGARFEGIYMLQSTSLELQSNNGASELQYGVTAHHFRLGAEYDILRGRVRPFVGASAGVEWLSPQSATPDELWFEASLEAGAKFRLTKTIGIRAQAEFTGVAMDARSQVFCTNGCYPAWYGIGTSNLALTAGPTIGF